MRWRILAVFAVLGGIFGLATTLLEEEDTGPQELYWSATHTLVVNPEAAAQGTFPNLLQTALRVTAGEVPASVAAQLDMEETDLKSRLRTVTDLEVVSLSISAVSTDREEARDISDSTAQALIEFLSREDKATYDQSLETVQGEVDTITVALDNLDIRIAELQDAIDAGAEADAEGEGEGNVNSLSDLREELRLAQIERDTRFTIFQTSLNQLDRLVSRGEPDAVLESLDTIPPFEINERVYNQRIRQGRQGAANFTVRTVPEESSGGVSLSQTVSSPFMRGVLGIIAGLILATAGVLLYMRFDPRLRSKLDIEEAFGMPVLAEIPQFEREDGSLELHSATRSRSVVTEAYRMVRSALLFTQTTSRPGPGSATGELDVSLAMAEPNDDVRVVMVTSPGPAEGKTTTTANLAVVLAEAGYEVLVINCDYRLPKLHKYFDLEFEPRRTLPTSIPGVTVVADVTPDSDENPTSVVEAQRALIAKARERYDVVLLDTAPMLATNDALGVLAAADLVVLVAKEGKTDREGARECAELLKRRRAKVAGVVVVGASGNGRSKYYYKYRYGNYYTEAEKFESQRKSAASAH